MLNRSRASTPSEQCAALRNDAGATAVEYGLMVGLIALAIVAAVGFLGASVADVYDHFGDVTGWY